MYCLSLNVFKLINHSIKLYLVNNNSSQYYDSVNLFSKPHVSKHCTDNIILKQTIIKNYFQKQMFKTIYIIYSMCVFMWVCMYVYVCTCVYVCMYVYT